MNTSAPLGSGPPGGTLTSLPPPVDEGDQQFDMLATEIANTLYLYYTPLLVILGCVGNFLSVFVFLTSKLRLQSTSQYLSALAVSDIVFLLQLLGPWLSATQITTIFHHYGFCQVSMYLSYVSCCYSAWLVVGFTMERFVAVLYPLQRNSVCTVARARMLVVGLAVVSLGLNVPVLRFASPRNGEDCTIDGNYLAHAARFNVADTVLSFTVPLGLIFALNACIVTGVCRVQRARRQLVRSDPTAAVTTDPCTRSQQRVTRMLLLVSSVFVVLNLPAYTIRVVAYTYGMNANDISEFVTAMQQITLMFFHTNFGINFILYCMSGQNFRRALVETIPWFRDRAAVVRRVTRQPAQTSSISSSRVSNMTKANTKVPSASGGAGPDVPSASGDAANVRRHPERFKKRWKFDNSRQTPRSAPSMAVVSTNVEAVEMRNLGIGRHMRIGAPTAFICTTRL